MNEMNVVHDTVVVERVYPVPRAVAFEAWADVEQRRRWHFPGDGDWVVLEMSQEFKVGGRELMRFGPKDLPNLMSDGLFLDIVADERIVSAGTMHRDGQRISVTLCSVEFADDAEAGTRVRLTDQSAYLDGAEKPEDRESGWGKIFERLRAHLEAGACVDQKGSAT